MYRLQYRNFGAYPTLVVNHTVDVDGIDHAGLRWYELRNSGNGWSVRQQGTYAPDENQRWMGSAAMDGNGDIALGYSASSGSVYPSIRYTGRVPSDPLGSLEAETVVKAGSGSQLQNLSRWGDYSAMSVDPVDDCTFWYTQEYTGGGSWNWYTRIGSFMMPTCAAPNTGTLSGTVTDAVYDNPIAGAMVQAGAYSTTTAADGTYSMRLAVGTYDVTASKFGYAPATVTGVVINDQQTTVQDFSLDPVGSAWVDGYVTDAGHGWPLYATITITGTADEIAPVLDLRGAHRPHQDQPGLDLEMLVREDLDAHAVEEPRRVRRDVHPDAGGHGLQEVGGSRGA